jgi:hypothetical protein
MKKSFLFIFLSSVTLAACSSMGAKNADSSKDVVNNVIATKGGVTLSYFIQSPDFPDASLTMIEPHTVKDCLMPGNILFQYDVKNFKLTDQTNGAAMCDCNNSNKGQHIHQIINNQPYIARYKDTFYSDLKPGNYVNLAFLSRSYHESVKNKNAYVLTQFKVGETKEKSVGLSSPLLFYSRPKGEYKGKDTANVLLDFYLVNTNLSPKGNKVIATINGNEFTLTKWTGYGLSGLKMGENTIKLELVNKDGKLIPGPYNSVERKIKLSAQ